MHFKKLLHYILISAFISTSPVVFAQTGPDDPSLDDPAVPIDGGITLLLAAGAAYGGHRLQKNAKRKKGFEGRP